MSEHRARILLVDDHRVLRDGLRILLEGEPDLEVVGEADTAAQGLELARSLAPDVVVMDLALPDQSGLEAIRTIRREGLECRIVVLSMHDRREFVIQAIEAGCDGFVPKSSTHTSLLRAIRVVLGGQQYLHPTAATAVVESMTMGAAEREQFAQLSTREQEVLRLTAVGYTGREIGQRLSISPKTAETYRQRAMEKLGLVHRAEVTKFALRAGILEDFRR
jgi:two-component system, NarL family, response regulator NreC